MSRELHVTAVAECDIADAFEWYEEKREGLGDDFLDAVESTYERIQRLPHLFPIVHEDVRRTPTNRFPYGVFYRSDDDRILVIAVLHDRRNPSVIASRLD